MSVQSEMNKKKKADAKREKLTFEQFMAAVMGDIDPAKYAGEGWYATEEYARPEDISNPFTRGEVGREGEYYPGPDLKRKMRKY
jgi:hypothetical protein